ncbi:Adenylate cyclase 1 [Shimia sp. SK013]|uniref:adenylate/guanylate cyclase domain-containing protein n=1 Tax=Shimia sp. SK013 TaxID=1389006 RepID=UPI0006B4CA5B|nr:adenylate/guanylate cyclase domain-containing protein [Shimia sp. SK013]KPA23510.1 Adenylate cyclase 1 [Shimia sp. SK013]
MTLLPDKTVLNRYLPTILFAVIAAGVVGAFYGYIMSQIVGRDFSAKVLMWGASRGIFVALAVLTLELLVHRGPVQRRMRAMAFVPAFVLRSIITSTHLIAALALSHWLYSPDWADFWAWVQRGLPRDFFFAAGTAFVVQLVLQAKRLVGGRTLRHFLMGRYNRPVQEDRIFVLADLVGFTAMADKLGDQRSLELVSGFFLDLDPTIHKYGAMIHNYVGDEVVMSWRDRGSVKNGRAVRCVRDMIAKTAEVRAKYLDTFGVAPTLRIGMAAGPVAVGECGWEKRQVIYIGDTINTAKRLQDACKPYGVSVMTDADTVARMNMPDDVTATEMGRTTLRGRETETLMMALGQDAGPYSLPALGN